MTPAANAFVFLLACTLNLGSARGDSGMPCTALKEASPKNMRSICLDGSEWIWYGATANVPAGDAYLRTSFALPAGLSVSEALLAFSCDNSASAKINGQEVARQGGGKFDWKEPTVSGNIANLLKPGVNTLEAKCRNGEHGWAGFIACLKIRLSDGRIFEVRTDTAGWQASKDGVDFSRPASGGTNGADPWKELPKTVLMPSMREYPDVEGVKSEWISAADAKEVDGKRRNQQLSADGTSLFISEFKNAADIKKATWSVSGLGVFEAFVNGKRIGGEDALKPGFTNNRKTKYYFTYDVTKELNLKKGEGNVLQAEVSSGWWRDKIVSYAGRKSAFRGELEIQYADGTKKVLCTNTADWKACVGGPVRRAGIFDGEIYDARIPQWSGDFRPAVANNEFRGEILPSEGAEICRRTDLALKPVEAYCWKGVSGSAADVFGKVVKTRSFKDGEYFTVRPGETLVVDFGQNAAAVPRFTKMKASEGVELLCLSGEMLNDSNGERSRGNDGPAGSVYRASLRIPRTGMRLKYTFATGDEVEYMPLFTFFGYRYISVTATGEVSFFVESVPVTSIKREMELGHVETGVEDVNKLISNIYWGQLSNYLSIPTDCPQRNERLGWTADTQVFAEAGSFNANTLAFLRKWMRDMRDSQDRHGGFPGVAPYAQYGNERMRFGWADAGVIVPYQMWKQFGDLEIIRQNLAAMEKYVAHCARTKYDFHATRSQNGGYQWADWLSYEDAGGNKAEYWNYLGACYWLWDARMMAEMVAAIGQPNGRYVKMADEAKSYILERFFTDGVFRLEPLNRMQTPALFALHLNLVEGAHKERMIENLRKNFKAHGDCLQTGFLGTSILMETLSANGMTDVAYTLLLQHKNPSWLYSVDQGATTVWERWNSYTKERGFGSVGMNSFNHYAYGAVLSWIYKVAAGISADPANPGFKNIIMAPQPDRRLGRVKAQYRTSYGVIRSEWRYEGDEWIWSFTIPEGSTADVTLPGKGVAERRKGGTYEVRLRSSFL